MSYWATGKIDDALTVRTVAVVIIYPAILCIHNTKQTGLDSSHFLPDSYLIMPYITWPVLNTISSVVVTFRSGHFLTPRTSFEIGGVEVVFTQKETWAATVSGSWNYSFPASGQWPSLNHIIVNLWREMKTEVMARNLSNIKDLEKKCGPKSSKIIFQQVDW